MSTDPTTPFCKTTPTSRRYMHRTLGTSICFSSKWPRGNTQGYSPRTRPGQSATSGTRWRRRGISTWSTFTGGGWGCTERSRKGSASFSRPRMTLRRPKGTSRWISQGWQSIPRRTYRRRTGPISTDSLRSSGRRDTGRFRFVPHLSTSQTARYHSGPFRLSETIRKDPSNSSFVQTLPTCASSGSPISNSILMLSPFLLYKQVGQRSPLTTLQAKRLGWSLGWR